MKKHPLVKVYWIYDYFHYILKIEYCNESKKPCNHIFLYLLLTDELVFGGTLTVEKKSNLLVSGATWVSLCFSRFCGVFTVTSSLKMLGLCTRRKRGKCHTCQLARVLTIHQLILTWQSVTVLLLINSQNISFHKEKIPSAKEQQSLKVLLTFQCIFTAERHLKYYLVKTLTGVRC